MLYLPGTRPASYADKLVDRNLRRSYRELVGRSPPGFSRRRTELRDSSLLRAVARRTWAAYNDDRHSGCERNESSKGTPHRDNLYLVMRPGTRG